MLAGLGERPAITGSTKDSLSLITFNPSGVVVAVKANMLTFFEIMLRTSPIFENATRKSSPNKNGIMTL